MAVDLLLLSVGCASASRGVSLFEEVHCAVLHKGDNIAACHGARVPFQERRSEGALHVGGEQVW